MNAIKYIFLISLGLIATAAFAQNGTTVINRDEMDHVLVIEDENGKTTEKTIHARDSLKNLCAKECYLSLKGTDEFEYVEEGEQIVFLIVDGHLVVDVGDD
ncbi:hypothetical protein KFE96_00150 [Kordiimonas sp. SCSIO 12603]|uniref:hypothetical protein n=1 Tax=Kordiimonas sp. SCSIO 12603 TaxID=2829596 RepID=UPI002103170B|nr:hypothetical protein [Kordiimonas sp. SCSIO 12603]UTW58753.1 hypothetical protein KFE96_00150 [Kordiimonas sp. SCSIO 12603]